MVGVIATRCANPWKHIARLTLPSGRMEEILKFSYRLSIPFWAGTNTAFHALIIENRPLQCLTSLLICRY